MSLRYYPSEVIRWRDHAMIKNSVKLAGIVIMAAVFATAVAPAQASGQLPIFKACLAKAETAPDPKSAKNQCIWNHWDLMAEYG